MEFVNFYFIIAMAAPQFVRTSSTGDSTIRALLLLFRHGDRAPVATFPNDIHGNHPWPGGYGALSPNGINQMYKTGLQKAQRYASFLQSHSFDSSKILVQSSHTPRCIDSALSFLEGFIPGKWETNIVNVIPAQDDEILAIHPAKRCPKYEGTVWSAIQPGDADVNKLVGDEKNFLEFLSTKTGLNTTQLRRFYFLSDSFKVHKDNGLPLPSWAEPIYESTLKPLGDLIFNKWGHTDRMHVRSGALLKDMVDKLGSFTEERKHNIFIYSGHDLNISALLIHLDAMERTALHPSYCATLAIELHANEDLEGGLEVKIFYFRDFMDEDPIQIALPGCEEPCSFAKFKAIVSPKLVSNYEKFCRL